MPTLQTLLRPLVMVSAVLLTAPLTPLDATAGFPVPSPGFSTVGQNLNLEPGGSIAFSVTVRDFSITPIFNSVVMIDLCACPAVVLCPGPPDPGEGIANGCQVLGVTGIDGTHVFHLKGGGGCSPVNVNIYADGVLLATRRVTSPDQNADLVVDLNDVDAINAKIGTSDLSGDLNADGAVTLADRVTLESYTGQICLIPTPTKRPTWGDLKIRYR